MRFDLIEHIPVEIRQILSPSAQIVFKNAYNEAWIRYEDEAERMPNTSRNEMANIAAWNAVKAQFQKVNDIWVNK